MRRSCNKSGTRTGWPQHVWALELKQQLIVYIIYPLSINNTTRDASAFGRVNLSVSLTTITYKEKRNTDFDLVLRSIYTGGNPDRFAGKIPTTYEAKQKSIGFADTLALNSHMTFPGKSVGISSHVNGALNNKVQPRVICCTAHSVYYKNNN